MADPTEKRGRPLKVRIDSVNIPTDLELDERFIEFRELSDSTEGEALLSVISLYKYVARHNAATGSVANLSDEKCARRCYWEKDPSLFVESLVESKILTSEKIIADWVFSQPHAIKRSHNIAYYQQQKEQELEEFKLISEDLSAEKAENGYREEKTEQRRKEKTDSGSAPSAIDLAITDFVTKYNKVAEKHPALRKVRIPLTPALRKKLITRLEEAEFVTDKVLLALHNSKFYLGDNDRNWAASFAWIIKNSENYLNILSAGQAAKAQAHPSETELPPPKCPKCGRELRDGEWCVNPKCGFVTQAYLERIEHNRKNPEKKSDEGTPK